MIEVLKAASLFEVLRSLAFVGLFTMLMDFYRSVGGYAVNHSGNPDILEYALRSVSPHRLPGTVC